MRRCVLCGESTLGEENFCLFHLDADEDNWATGNRIMCDFLHRRIVPSAGPERPDALDLPIETLDEALVP
jgi:hypothetical protein